jgi:preprotein translocase subunit SecA
MGVAVRWFFGNKPLEADVRESLFAHHLVQVGTGEGKSIILAVTAAVPAVIGFEVNVACYSQYLTERDFEEFLPLFKTLGVHDKVFYGTFNQICERMINEG